MSDEKPPLGILPHKLWLEDRIYDLSQVIMKYRRSGQEPKEEWCTEIDRLRDELFGLSISTPKSRLLAQLTRTVRDYQEDPSLSPRTCSQGIQQLDEIVLALQGECDTIQPDELRSIVQLLPQLLSQVKS